jgi:trimethylamine:corrinoid methyltransferase-like protein
MEKRIKFIEHKGKQILHLDFTRARADEVIKIIDAAKGVIAAQPEQSLRTLSDVSDMKFDSDATAAMKEFVNHNKPYVAAAAVVGVTGLKQIIYNAVVKFSGRNLVAFDTHGQAKDWLASQ